MPIHTKNKATFSHSIEFYYRNLYFEIKKAITQTYIFGYRFSNKLKRQHMAKSIILNK